MALSKRGNNIVPEYDQKTKFLKLLSQNIQIIKGKHAEDKQVTK